MISIRGFFRRSSGSKRDESEPELFKKRVPNLAMLLFPRKFLWYWFSRRFSVFAKKWGVDEEKRMASPLVRGLMNGKSPRFRLQEQALYFVDMLGQKVVRYSLATQETAVIYEDAEDFVSAVGWLPDGRMLIVRMNHQQVLVLDQKSKNVELYADVSNVTQFRANDLVVAASGRVYLGNFGFDHAKMESCCTTTLVSIDPVDRQVRVEATEMLSPNGMVITPDGKTLIVAETFAGRLAAFDIDEGGKLANRRVWADVRTPLGGICLDAEGCVWVSVPQAGAYEATGGALARVKEGGEIMDLLGFQRNGISHGVYACALGQNVSGGEPQLYFVESVASKEATVFMQGRRKARENSVLKSVPVAVGPALMPSNSSYCGGYC
ncbi:hypothetical protein BBJ28_00009475 [Nothophytophthora sp. Chile5]|nr:hypothetical protein BBJ28_00009475 [Nothophytophthora sp. Chile5]